MSNQRPLPSLVILLWSSVLSGGCQHTEQPSQATNRIQAASIQYPYVPSHSVNWQPGQAAAIQRVLVCLKKYDTGDIKGAMSSFADSIRVRSDGFDFYCPKDSFEAILLKARSPLRRVSKDFDHWLSVFDPGSGETWVKIAFKEKWTTQWNQTDSLYYAVDVVLKDNQIVCYDEKQRRYPK